jgi:hypothetical protein
MATTIEINSITLSGDTQEILKRWQNSSCHARPSDPELYVNYLNDTQDYLIQKMLEDGLEEQNVVADLLTKLICIKTDLKLLTPKNQES